MGGYFPGNSLRGRLARGLRLGRRESGYSSCQPTPSTSFASNFSNTRDTLWALAYRAMFRRDAHISGDASSSNHEVSPFVLVLVFLPFGLPPCFPRSDWPPLVTSKYNRVLLVQFASDCNRVRAEAKDDESFDTTTADGDEDEEFREINESDFLKRAELEATGAG